ncbi:MAG: TraR/DksA family transcriptional regulator [Candidatus Dormibacteria bacterium]
MNTEHARKSLEAERARLEQVREAAGRLSSGGEGGGDVDAGPNPSEQATETIAREIDQNVLQSAEVHLQELADALRRLDDGTYGLCQVCGQQIGEARLEAMPATRFCVEDQARAERDPRFRTV